MRIFEIILKLLFLIGAIFTVTTGALTSQWFTAFLVVGLVLGIVLLLNDKSPSYKYKNGNSGRVLAMRRLEGALLILFVVYALAMTNA